MLFLLSVVTNPPDVPVTNNFAFIGQLFSTALAFVFVLILAYYSTKWIASSTRVVRQAKGNIKVLESVSLGFQSSVQLVKAADKYILLGVTKEKITFLTEVSPDDLVTGEPVQSNPFEKYLNRLLPKKKDS